MSTQSPAGSEGSKTPDRQSVGSGSGKHDSRPDTGGRGYARVPNLHDNSPKGGVVSAHVLVYTSYTLSLQLHVSQHL